MKKLSLKKEIVLVLAIKCMLLYGLWFLCFSHPVDKNSLTSLTTLHLLKEKTHD